MKLTKFERVKKEKSIFEQAVELVRIQAEKTLRENKNDKRRICQND